MHPPPHRPRRLFTSQSAVDDMQDADVGGDQLPPPASLGAGLPLLPPPHYTPSSSTPSYSYNPQDGEQRLAIATRDGWHQHASLTGSFVTQDKRTGITLRLNQQEEGIPIPTFGRNAIINGQLTLKDAQYIKKVEVEMEGHLKLTIAEGGKRTRSLFSTRRTIWVKGGENSRQCPDSLEFLIQMPSTYTDTTRTRNLPPSYQIIFPGVPGLFAHTVYSLTVHVMRARKMLWTRTDELRTEIKYYPRTRAPRQIVKQSLCFHMLLKIAPEEFYQVESVMETRTNSGFAPIRCQFFIPASCIYAMTDEIPFHIQLVAPLSSLLAFSYPFASSRFTRSSFVAQLQTQLTSPLLSSSVSNSSIRTASTLSNSIMQNLNNIGLSMGVNMGVGKVPRRPIIRVFLLRQITVEVRGQKAWRTCILGEGNISLSPPGPFAASSQRISSRMRTSLSTSSGAQSQGHRNSLLEETYPSSADPIEALDYDGTVKVANPAEIQVGGFAAGSLVVKDFIVLSLIPPDPARNPLIEHQYAHPVRLVTDPLEDYW